MLAYTDGLIERLGHELDVGIQKIADLLDWALYACPPFATQILDQEGSAAGPPLSTPTAGTTSQRWWSVDSDEVTPTG